MDLQGKNILFIGCGGGYDIFCSLPLYFKYYQSLSTNMILANYSFTNNELLKLGIPITDSSFLISKTLIFNESFTSE